jgi:hypothetical protein
MCLYIKRFSKIKQTAEDIICYKVIRFVHGITITPYRKVPIEIGEEYVSNLLKGIDNTVDVGIHSFATLTDATDEAADWRFYNPAEKFAVAKCIIPAGSLYIQGTFNISGHDAKSIASNCIVYKSLI